MLELGSINFVHTVYIWCTQSCTRTRRWGCCLIDRANSKSGKLELELETIFCVFMVGVVLGGSIKRPVPFSNVETMVGAQWRSGQRGASGLGSKGRTRSFASLASVRAPIEAS